MFLKLGGKGFYPMMKRQALQSQYREDLEKARLNVAALVANERLEMKHKDATVVRAYTERLISEAVENGDCHTHTMEMAKWWLHSDKAAIHKLFQVRFTEFRNDNCTSQRLLCLDLALTLQCQSFSQTTRCSFSYAKFQTRFRF